MSLKRVLLSLTLTFSIVVPTFVSAQVLDNNQTKATVESNKEINQKDEAWDNRKKEIERAMIEAYSNGNQKDVNKKLEELGLEYLGSSADEQLNNENTNNDIGILSSGTNVTMNTTYYRDRFSGKYLIQGSWSWDATYTYDSNPSPYDAFGLWMSNVSDGKPATGQVFESEGCAVYNTRGTDINGNMWVSDFDPANAGVAWTVNDVLFSSDDYTGDYGQGWIWMSKPPSQSVYLRAKLVHTYQGGSVSGISIGTSGLSVNLTNVVKSWEKVSPIKTISSWPSN